MTLRRKISIAPHKLRKLLLAPVAKLAIAVLCTAASALNFAQTPMVDLGIDMGNPDFITEFNGSFEVGLNSGAPTMSEKDSVMISVLSEMYQEDIDAALSFILEEIRNETRRIETAQRYRRSLDPDYVYSANIEYAIGQLYQIKGNRLLAERYYLQAIEKYPAYVSAYIRLMEMYLYQEDCPRAITAGKKAVEIGGVNGFVFKGFGLCFFLEGDFDAALSAFRSAKVFLTDDEPSDYYHALSAINMGYADEAIAILDELIRKNPNNSNYYFLQVNAFLLKEDNDGVLGTIEIARRKGMLNTTTYSLLGNIYVNMEMPESAAQAYIAGLELDEPPRFNTVAEQFQHLSRLNDWQSAEAYLNAVVAVYGDRLSASNRRVLDVMQARVLIDSGQPSEGALLLREVLADDPTNGDALLSIARLYRAQQDFERAAINYQRAVNDEDIALTALVEYAQLATDMEDWQSAIDILFQASELADEASLPTITENIRAIERVLEIVN